MVTGVVEMSKEVTMERMGLSDGHDRNGFSDGGGG
jgi:hypothetical protein